MCNSEPFRYSKLALAIASTALVSTVSSGVRAEDEKNNMVLEEIIVTAQKRSESLQDTPIAISAFSTDALEDLGVANATDLGEYTPNVTITKSLGSTFNIRMSVRGNGNAEPSLAVDPKVGVYLDGVYMARNSGAVFDIVALERVEILRGPQGTLWGKNTTGGAVNIVTAKPQGELGFKQKLTFGTDSLYRSVTTLDTPEVAGVSAKLTYMKKSYDGWMKNTSTSPVAESDLGSEDSQAYRLALRWDVSDDLSIDYAYDQTNGESVAEATQLSEVLGVQFAPIGLTINTVTGIGYAGNPFAAMAAQAEANKRLDTFNTDGAGSEHVDIKGHSLTASWALDDLELKSITSYREYESFVTSLDTDGTSVEALLLDPLSGYTLPLDPVTMATGFVPGFHTSNDKSQQQFSQEFQALGSALDESLQYVFGLYYFSEDGKEVNPWEITIYNPAASANAALTIPLGGYYSVDSTSSAVFGQVSYDVTDKLSLTLGMRYTEDEKGIVLLAIDPALTSDHAADKSWSKFTTGITANYALNEDINLYAKVSEGYASGAFNPGSRDRSGLSEAENVAPALNPVDPEEILSYELGLKSMLLDGRLQLNIATFYNDNTDLQQTDLVGGNRITTNSGESTDKGIEADVLFILTPSIFLNASYGYLDTAYKDEKVQITPKGTGTVGIRYDFPPFDFGQLTARVDATYTGANGFSIGDPDTGTESYKLLNARVSLDEITVGDGNLKVALWGKNLSDEEYIVHGANFSFYRAYTWGAPRSVGVDLSYEF